VLPDAAAIDHTTLLFFDASCLVAAAGSSSGGSAFLLTVCRRGFLRGAVSLPVLLEAERNVAENMVAAKLSAFHELLATTPLRLVPVPTAAAIHRAQAVVGAKDAHVLAAAIDASAPFLVTLDRPLALRVNEGSAGIQALSPGEFITRLLPRHVDYPSIR
jgi:predicted nucleic acid-binding protein